MRMNQMLKPLSIGILVLALVAASAGLFWQGGGLNYEVTTPRGDTALIQGGGLYAFDTVSAAAQERGTDVVTLVLGIPLLITGLLLSSRGSMRGHLLLAGSLGYFLYTYAAMAFLTAFNSLFLVYVTLFSLSLFAFILTLSGLKPDEVVKHVSPHYPRKLLIGFFIAVAAFLSFAWLGMVAASMRTGHLPLGSESYTTLVIQALDLGVIVPTSIITAVLLWQKNAWGYVLSTVVILKVLMLGASLIAMIVSMALTGVPLEPVTTILFIIIAYSGMVLAVLTLRSIDQREGSARTSLSGHPV